MKRVYTDGPHGKVDVTPAPRWIRFLIDHNLPWRLLNRIAILIRATWDPDARALLRRSRPGANLR